MMLDDSERRKRTLIDGLANGNTGIGGVPDVSQLAGAEPTAPGSSHYSYTTNGVTTSGDAPNDVSPAGVAKLNAEHPEFAGGQPLAPAAPDYTKVGKYTSDAYDPNKFNVPWDQRSEKYQIGTVLSNFDPNLGMTPEVLAALNAANIHGAKFSGNGDQLNVDNAGNYARFGQGGSSDTITGLHSGGNAKWGAWTDPALAAQGQPAQGQAAQAGGGAAGAFPSIAGGALSGDPMAAIQAALKQYAGQSGKLEALLAGLRQ